MQLTVKDVSVRLHVPVETVLRWVRQGKIPMQQCSGEYVIRFAVLEHWAQVHNLKMTDPAEAETGCESDFDGVYPAMHRGGVFYDLPGAAKADVLQSAVQLLPNLRADERNRMYEKLMEREALGSTGIGHGMAIPHPRANPGIILPAPQISTFFLNRPIPFEAVDQEPVSMLLVLLSNSTQQHLKMLSALAYHLRDKALRDFLLSAPDPPDLFGRIAAVTSQEK